MEDNISETSKNEAQTDNGNHVTVVPGSKKGGAGKTSPLEKELIKFQQLLADIAKLETQGEQQKINDEEYHQLYAVKVQPVLVEVAKAQLLFVDQIESVFNAGKFSRNFEVRFVDFVIPILEDAAVYFDAATNKLHNYRVWQASLGKKETGIIETTAPSANESNNDDGETYSSAFRNQYKSNNNDSLDDFAGKSISALYKELAKMIHPDLEQDHERKEEKEQLMKTLVDAKNGSDLYAMLLMRQRAILLNNDEVPTTNVFSMQELKSYNGLLKQKLESLRRSIDRNFFGGGQDSFFAKNKKQLTPKKRVKEDVQNLRALQESLLHNARVITSSSQLKELLDL